MSYKPVLPFLLLVWLSTAAAVQAAEPPADSASGENPAAKHPVEKDFIYKKTVQGELNLVVTLPPDAKPGDRRSAIVFFSGGAWANSNINQFKDMASYLALRGMVAVRANYRVFKTHNVGPDKCVEDARSAVRWVREHAVELGIDPDRVAASGASAGGHLAACTATPVAPDSETNNLQISCMPNALVLINCVADLTPGPLAARAGGAEMAHRISPVRHVSTKTPPTLIMDGSDDNWVTTAKQFTDRATALGVRCEFYIADGEGHQFIGRSPWRDATIRKLDEFLISLGWLSGPPVMEMPNAVAWVRYQPDPAAKPNGNISPPTRRAKAPAKLEAAESDPKTDGNEDNRSDFLKEVRGQRVFVCGHSFHMPVAGMLPEIEKFAGIKDQQPVGQQRMSGSTVTQHWNLADEQNMLKKALRAGTVDVLTLSPTAQLPDDGIDKFTELALEHNAKVRILVQASWVGFDSPTANPRTFKNEQRDVAKPDDLRKVYDPFYKIMCDQVRKLNDNNKDRQQRQVVYVVPVAYAVIALREKVAEGKAPGIARQSELFRDDRGHGKPAIYLLATYCNYAIIYGRSPVGLPAPASLKRDVKAEHVEQLNRLLQEIAWDTVTSHSLAGVMKERPAGQP